MKCAITLLNWEEKITYDSMIRPMVQVSSSLLEQAIDAYILACDNHTLITSIEKQPDHFHPTSPSSSSLDALRMLMMDSSVRLEHYRVRYSELLQLCTNGKKQREGEGENESAGEVISIGLIRAGYTSGVNSEHVLLVMDLISGYTLFTIHTLALLPTVEEYLDVVTRLWREYHILPTILSIDAYEHYHVLHSLFTSSDTTNNSMIEIWYYPPPSSEYVDLAKSVASSSSSSSSNITNMNRRKKKKQQRGWSQSRSSGWGSTSTSMSMSMASASMEDTNGIGNGNGIPILRAGSLDSVEEEEHKEGISHEIGLVADDLHIDGTNVVQQRGPGPYCAYCGIGRCGLLSSVSANNSDSDSTTASNSKKVVFYRCGECKSVYYCSRAHQREDWKDHSLICCFPILSPHASFSICTPAATTSATNNTSSATAVRPRVSFSLPSSSSYPPVATVTHP